MLRRSQEAKDQITDILRSQGYATYARLFQLFDFYFTDDPNVIAYMIPQKAALVMNEGIDDEDTASVLVRHEILHEYLTHYERQTEFDKNHPELNPPTNNNQIANIAADYEISNRGYTDKDKIKVRNIMLNDQILSGLVTEDDHQNWANLTFEEMYEKLLKERQQGKNQAQKQMNQFSDLDSDQLQDLMDQIDQIIDQLDQQQQQQGGNSQDSKDQEEKDGENEEDKPSDQQKGQKPQNKGTQTGQNTQKDIDELEKAANQVDQMKDTIDKMDSDGKPFDNKQEANIKSDIEARAKRIQEEIRDIATKNGLIKEVDTIKNKERVAKAARQDKKYARSGLRQFTLSLNRFIKNEIESGEDLSYRKPNASYSRSKFLVPSYTQVEGPVPTINVYHDVSGSFNDERKTAAAMQAIATLNKYVKQGEVKINLYYFADRVSSSKNAAGGGTRGTPILEHIKSTKPQNVIVITDSDIGDCTETVTVPGAVWLLFYDAKSENLIDSLKGAKETRYYMIDY